MSKKEEKVTIRISEKKLRVANKVKEDFGMSVAKQFRDAHEFWLTVILGVATGSINEDTAIEEFKNYAAVLRGEYKEPLLMFKKVMRETEKALQEKEKDSESNGYSTFVFGEDK